MRSPYWRAHLRTGLCIGALSCLAACAGNGPPPRWPTPTPTAQNPAGTPSISAAPATPTPTPTPGVRLKDIEVDIFAPNCLSSGCHNSRDQAGRLVLEPGVSFGELVGQVPDNPAARAAGEFLVDPEHPGNSLLLLKLAAPPPGQGTRMPLGQAPLPESQINLIREWIVAGAAP